MTFYVVNKRLLEATDFDPSLAFEPSKGVRGIRGSAGPQGNRGEAGIRGLLGCQGDMGSGGNQGDTYFNLKRETVYKSNDPITFSYIYPAITQHVSFTETTGFPIIPTPGNEYHGPIVHIQVAGYKLQTLGSGGVTYQGTIAYGFIGGSQRAHLNQDDGRFICDQYYMAGDPYLDRYHLNITTFRQDSGGVGATSVIFGDTRDSNFSNEQHVWFECQILGTQGVAEGDITVDYIFVEYFYE